MSLLVNSGNIVDDGIGAIGIVWYLYICERKLPHRVKHDLPLQGIDIFVYTGVGIFLQMATPNRYELVNIKYMIWLHM